MLLWCGPRVVPSSCCPGACASRAVFQTGRTCHRSGSSVRDPTECVCAPVSGRVGDQSVNLVAASPSTTTCAPAASRPARFVRSMSRRRPKTARRPRPARRLSASSTTTDRAGSTPVGVPPQGTWPDRVSRATRADGVAVGRPDVEQVRRHLPPPDTSPLLRLAVTNPVGSSREREGAFPATHGSLGRPRSLVAASCSVNSCCLRAASPSHCPAFSGVVGFPLAPRSARGQEGNPWSRLPGSAVDVAPVVPGDVVALSG